MGPGRPARATRGPTPDPGTVGITAGARDPPVDSVSVPLFHPPFPGSGTLQSRQPQRSHRTSPAVEAGIVGRVPAEPENGWDYGTGRCGRTFRCAPRLPFDRPTVSVSEDSRRSSSGVRLTVAGLSAATGDFPHPIDDGGRNGIRLDTTSEPPGRGQPGRILPEEKRCRPLGGRHPGSPPRTAGCKYLNRFGAFDGSRPMDAVLRHRGSKQ